MWHVVLRQPPHRKIQIDNGNVLNGDGAQGTIVDKAEDYGMDLHGDNATMKKEGQTCQLALVKNTCCQPTITCSYVGPTLVKSRA